ncbi:uncharacterized protein PFL1_00004 [Pseudozyma flocculosa PF-1]|nr:uncharacterized protein PFL1_00004 [Pseudozyma flocculosa PF-1]EPQ31805.1 hypothetical protein PFL1_00004 [Pseudozyma flocculosa PF-1]
MPPQTNSNTAAGDAEFRTLRLQDAHTDMASTPASVGGSLRTTSVDKGATTWPSSPAPSIHEEPQARNEGYDEKNHGSDDDDVEKGRPRPSGAAAAPGSTAAAAAATTPPPPPNFPEGGRAAWCTVVGACCSVMVSFGLITSYGVFQSHYVSVLDRSNSDISWIGSLQTGFFYLVGAVVGRLYDALGPKRLTLAGTLLLCFGLMMTSLATRYYQLLLSQGIAVGLGAALLFYPALLSVPSYFLRLRGLAVGIVVAGAALGGVIWPIALQRMFLDPSLGFGWTVRILGFIVLALGLVATALVTTRAPPRKHGAFLERQAWSDVRYTATVVGAAFSTLGFFVPYFYIESFAIMKGVSTDVAFYSVTALNGGSLLGRLFSAGLCDRFGKFNTLLASSLASTLLCLAFWLPLGATSGLNASQAVATTMSFAVLFGFGNGAFFSASLPALASFTPLTHLGLRAGMLYTVLTIPALVGTPISGAFLSEVDDAHFVNLIIWSSLTQLVGFLAFAVARYRISPRLWHAV